MLCASLSAIGSSQALGRVRKSTRGRPWSSWTVRWRGARRAGCRRSWTSTVRRVARAASGLAAANGLIGTGATGASTSPSRRCGSSPSATAATRASPVSRCATSPARRCRPRCSATSTIVPCARSAKLACPPTRSPWCCQRTAQNASTRSGGSGTGASTASQGTQMWRLTSTCTTALAPGGSGRASEATSGWPSATVRSSAAFQRSSASGAWLSRLAPAPATTPTRRTSRWPPSLLASWRRTARPPTAGSSGTGATARGSMPAGTRASASSGSGSQRVTWRTLYATQRQRQPWSRQLPAAPRPPPPCNQPPAAL
mmetsp:Transcript_47573/g.132260  ORF Transcript_47573/g.132260 Transcript_47573/m.132260 type:complete len:314 (+) Transcript_47573:1025-1966(+)